ncbi:MAG: hypothetical protein ACK4PI_08750 [Tepidisphaerales bacterium]
MRSVDAAGDEAAGPRTPRVDTEIGQDARPIPPRESAESASAGRENAYAGEQIQWVVPAGWVQRPASGMRYATLVPPGGPEVTVTRLSGDGGGILANLNRWRGQVFLPPITAEQLLQQTQNISLGGVTAVRVDVVGPQGRILGAMLPAPSGQTWFFKAQTTTPEAMDAIVSDFDRFLQTVRLVP